jgi:hypothetical protein
MTIHKILEQVKVLSAKEREELVQQLLMMRDDSTEPDKIHDILEFEGIASHLADDEDPQVYVNRLRTEWGCS